MTEADLPSTVNPRSRRWVWVVGTLLVLSCFLMGYIHLKLEWAHRQVVSLCEAVVIDMPIKGLESKAMELGLSVSQTPPKQQPGFILAHEGFGPGRWACVIDHAAGKVISKRIMSPS